MAKEQDEDLVREFLAETYENLERLDRELVELERNVANEDTLASVFRTLHTIKGTCGFLGFAKLESVAHRGESLLSKLRDGALDLGPEITAGLLALVDAIRQILACIEHDEGEGDVDYALLIDRLSALEQGAGRAAPQHGAVTHAVREAAPEARAPAGADASIRVDVRVLDRLMTLVGELVLARNQIVQRLRSGDGSGLATTCQRLDLVTGELQDGIMQTRMQPIANVWSRLPRLTRDLAVACGKQVRLEMSGEDTELDRALIEAIKDPLTHIVRNAIDHGIEPPEVRTAAGKPAEGRLLLGAFHEGGFVNVEICDDGAGIDTERIRAKAIARGLVAPERAEGLSESELVDLIFLPGVSTAERVTNVSGRGVGMDVVKSNIERLGGSIEVRSRPGCGTRFRIEIPLTLAIIPAVVVESAGDRYAVPQSSLVELVRLEGDAARRGIEHVHEAAVHRLRGRLLPLVDLARELGTGDRLGARAPNDTVSLVVLRAGEELFGLVVDAVHDTEEIVVKPLASQLEHLAAFSGATILGDGTVALILDVLGLSRRAGVAAAAGDGGHAEPSAERAGSAGPAPRYVIAAARDGRQLAIALEQVARLETVPRAAIERAADVLVAQCRGRILPLLDVGDVLDARRGDNAPERLHVVVCAGSRPLGIVVERVVDVIEARIEIETTGTRAGILGSALIAGRVTEIVDIAALSDSGVAARRAER